jgi:succinate dehydrogenase / fumarate reductase iron-sulfur subunit
LQENRIKPTAHRQPDWPKSAGSKVQVFRICRWNPDDAANPWAGNYHIDQDDCGPMVLDALIWINNKVDSPLVFRRSCHHRK